MGYSGKAQLDKSLETSDHPHDPSDEKNDDHESSLPIGRLKWSKEDETCEDTKLNLEKEKSQGPVGSKKEELIVQESKGISDDVEQSSEAHALADSTQTNVLDQEKEQVEYKYSTSLAMKILWLPVVLFIVLVVGLVVGHSVIGDKPAGEVFDINMWEHMYNLLFG